MSAFKVFTNDIPQFFSIQLFFIASLAPLSSTVSETQCLEGVPPFLHSRCVTLPANNLFLRVSKAERSVIIFISYICLFMCYTCYYMFTYVIYMFTVFITLYTRRVDHYVLDMKSIISEIYYEVQQTILWRELVSNHDQTLTNLWTLTTLLIRLLTTYFIINIYCLFYIYIVCRMYICIVYVTSYTECIANDSHKVYQLATQYLHIRTMQWSFTDEF